LFVEPLDVLCTTAKRSLTSSSVASSLQFDVIFLYCQRIKSILRAQIPMLFLKIKKVHRFLFLVNFLLEPVGECHTILIIMTIVIFLNQFYPGMAIVSPFFMVKADMPASIFCVIVSKTYVFK
jgi:hypothetical protein